MIDCCERLALIALTGRVLSKENTVLGASWLMHHVNVHVNAVNGEACSVCKDVAKELHSQQNGVLFAEKMSQLLV